MRDVAGLCEVVTMVEVARDGCLDEASDVGRLPGNDGEDMVYGCGDNHVLGDTSYRLIAAGIDVDCLPGGRGNATPGGCLAPVEADNADKAALSARSIQLLALNSMASDTGELGADRSAGDVIGAVDDPMCSCKKMGDAGDGSPFGGNQEDPILGAHAVAASLAEDKQDTGHV